MRKALQIASVFALTAVLSTNAFAAIDVFGTLNDDNISLLYNPANGNMSIDAAGKQISTFELISESGILTGATPALVAPPFDVHTPFKFFVLKTDGIGDTDLGQLAAPGLARDMMAADLTLNGSILPSGGLGNADLVWVPEPASMGMALIGLLGLLGVRRK